MRALHAGSLQPGDRLPSARELESEFDTDHRIILAAYRELVAERLVELRARGGIYVHAGATTGGVVPHPAETWIVDVLTQGITREVPVSELHEWLRRSVETLRLRAAVIAGTTDQLVGICRELEDDYGLQASGVDLATFTDDRDLASAVKSADLLVTTEAQRTRVAALAARLGKRHVVIGVRLDLVGGEWRMLLRRPVYVIVTDARFIEMLRGFFANVPGADNLRPLLLGRDDVAAIPDGAPTYVTQSARDKLGDTRIKGRIIPAARVLSTESAREIISFIVGMNLEALAARHRQ